jgi:hypothetical protein
MLFVNFRECPWRPVFRFNKAVSLFTIGKTSGFIIPDKNWLSCSSSYVWDIKVEKPVALTTFSRSKLIISGRSYALVFKLCMLITILPTRYG